MTHMSGRKEPLRWSEYLETSLCEVETHTTAAHTLSFAIEGFFKVTSMRVKRGARRYFPAIICREEARN